MYSTTYTHTHPEPDRHNYALSPPPSHPPTCLQNHRPSLSLETDQGGSICLLCFSNLVSNPTSPTFHVSYALSQLSHAILQPRFISSLLSFHAHMIISPLVRALSCFCDDQVAKQVVDVVTQLCRAGGGSVCGDFVARIADEVSSCSLVWSRRQFYSLHCFGVLLTQQTETYACVKDKAALAHNLVMGLQLPSEEIQGEIMFVLYRICLLQNSSKDEGSDVLLEHCPTILHLTLDALMKTQRDDVRLNCLALLKALAQRGFLSEAFSDDFNMMDTCEADNYTQTSDAEAKSTSLTKLFAESIKSPLLSPDNQVQITALDLIFHWLSRGNCSCKQIQVLVDENVADYVFEILRLSEQKDQVVSSCVQVLDLLSIAEQAFKQRLAIGFTTLISVLPQVAEVRSHPLQPQMLKLILDGVSSFPGIVSTIIVEGISSPLGHMLKKYAMGEMSMLSETFVSVCSIFVALMKSPSASRVVTLLPTVEEASKHALLTSLSIYNQDPSLLLHSLSLLKEAYSFSHEVYSVNNSSEMQMTELSRSVLEVCQKQILPWFVTAINEMEEESILGIFETLQFLLLQAEDDRVLELTQALLSYSWFTLSFGCLGLYPTEKMKLRVYLMFSAIMDNVLGENSGESIRAVASALPADPVDLLFLLGQKSSNNLELSSCQTAVLQILYISSLYDEMLADIKLILASLEQYMLSNSSHLLFGAADTIGTVQLVNLYGLCRSTAKLNYQMSYSPGAEQIFFQLLMERDWDLSTFNIHSTSLKWLFQQERISKSLSCQLLKLCRKSCSTLTEVHCQILNFQDIALLTAVGDNLLPNLLVLLLAQVVGKEMVMDDVISLLHFLSSIINMYPHASDQLCMHGIGNAVHSLCSAFLCSSSLDNYMVVLRFIFVILSSVHAQTLNDDEVWCAVIMKLLDSFSSTMTANGWSEQHLLMIGILSLCLHHSTQGVLTKTSKFILMNTSLASLIRATIDEISVHGSASIEQDEGTDTEQALVFLLLFFHAYLRSLRALLPGSIYWREFLNPRDEACSYPSIGIHSQDVCRFLHYGSPPVKLVASHCLVELLTNITDQHNSKQNDMKCIIGYLRSIISVLEGLVFHCNLQIATNCGLCLSVILSWDIPGHHSSLARNNDWCRMIVEELATSVAVPCSVSASPINHHRPAVHIATALLKSKTAPLWMRSVFNDACLSSMIEKLSPNNITSEVVVLLQELLQSGYLKPDQIAKLSHLLQARRKGLFMENHERESMGQQTTKVITMSSGMRDVCDFLLNLMSVESHSDVNSRGDQADTNKLVQEIDLYFRILTEMERHESIG